MAISQEFLSLLVHPLYKTPLQYDDQGDRLSDELHSKSFEIRDGVPILLENADADTENYREHYQQDAAVYDYTKEAANGIERAEIRRLRQTIFSVVPKDPKWLLDAGCGGAWLAKHFLPQGKNVISMDISDINPIKALKNFPSKHHFAVVADVFALPFPDNSLDAIVASEIIEHVPDPKLFLEKLFAVVKPGGRLIVTTPYNEVIRTSLCIHCNRETPNNAHLHSFTVESMRKLLPENHKTVSLRIFNGKLAVKSGLQRLCSFMPLGIWRGLDRFLIFLTGKKAYRLMVILEKGI